jgi:hypothetical protein
VGGLESEIIKVQVTVASLVTSLCNEKPDCYLEMTCPPPDSEILNMYAHVYADINKGIFVRLR